MRAERRQALVLELAPSRGRRLGGQRDLAEAVDNEPRGSEVASGIPVGGRKLFAGSDAQPTGKSTTGACGPAFTWNSTSRPPGFSTRNASRYTPALSAMFITALCE